MAIDLDQASVYVGTYAKYNDGSLGGEWVDLSDFSDEDEFLAHIHDLHSDEEEPEFMFQDYENIPDELISESGLSSKFWELKDTLSNLYDPQIITEFMDAFGASLEDALDNAEDYFYGKGDFGEFAYDMLMDNNDVPEFLRGYIDWEKWEQDLGYDYTVSDNGYIFLNY